MDASYWKRVSQDSEALNQGSGAGWNGLMQFVVIVIKNSLDFSRGIWHGVCCL
jgi:hypothetical protein